MSTSLVPSTQSNTLAILNNNIAGLEGFDRIKIARMELVQRTTRAAEAQPGQFRDTLTNDHFEELRVVPLQVKRGRVLFPPGGDLNNPPVCRSSDGIVPHPGVENPKNDLCKTCPHSSWAGYNRKTKTGKPDCQEKWNLLFIKRDSFMPYWMSFGATSIKLLRDVLQGIQRSALESGMKGDASGLYDYTFTMKPTRIDGQRGTYFVVSFGGINKLKPEDRTSFGPLYQQFVTERKNEYEQADNEASVEQGFAEA